MNFVYEGLLAVDFYDGDFLAIFFVQLRVWLDIYQYNVAVKILWRLIHDFFSNVAEATIGFAKNLQGYGSLVGLFHHIVWDMVVTEPQMMRPASNTIKPTNNAIAIGRRFQ